MKTPRTRKRLLSLGIVLSLTFAINYAISEAVDSRNQPIGSGTPRPSISSELTLENQPIGSGTPRPSIYDENQPIGSGTPRPSVN